MSAFLFSAVAVLSLSVDGGSRVALGSTGGRRLATTSSSTPRLTPPPAMSAPASGSGSTGGSTAAAIPPLSQSPPRKVSLLVEPTPFTHVSGYSNRFKEMLRYLQLAGDDK